MSFHYSRNNDPPGGGGGGGGYPRNSSSVVSNNSSSSTANKFTIRPFRAYTQMDSNSALQTFASLSSAMDEIHFRNASSLSFEELYRNAYNLVLHKHGGLLYEGVQDRLIYHLRNNGRKLMILACQDSGGGTTTSSSYSEDANMDGGEEQKNNNDSNATMTNAAAAATTTDARTPYKLLEEIVHVWSEHRITMLMIRDIFMYMDRTYVPQHRKRPVYELGLWLFRNVVWERNIYDWDDNDKGCNHYLDGQAKMMAGTTTTTYVPHPYQPLQQQQQPPQPPIIFPHSPHSSISGLLLGNVASNLILQAIHQDRLDRLEDAPQRMALLRQLIHMLLELAHANHPSGQYNEYPPSSSSSSSSTILKRPSEGQYGIDCIPIYERDFEEVFLGESQEFYRRESTSRLSHSASESTSSMFNSNDYDLNNNSNSSSINYTHEGKPAAKYSAMEYVHRAQSRIEEEKTRSVLLDLPIQTKSALLRIVETELIERHAKTLVDMEGSGFACILKVVASSPTVGSVAATTTATTAGSISNTSATGGGGGGDSGDSGGEIHRLSSMMGGIDSSESGGVVIDRERIADLAAMYDLFSRIPSSVNHLRDALSERIRLDGRALVRDQETNVSPPSAFVKGVLDMRERFHAVVSMAMRGEKKAQKRMSEAFEDFLNADARAANCLAVYVDELLRVGLRGADERKVARELDRVVVIFRYLADKDVFEAYYKNHLAKRLLGNKSGSEEAERAMVSLLKAECGYQFTSKLEGMFNDMRISRETAEKYRSHKKMLTNASLDARDAENGGKPVDLDVNVLSNSHWPSQNIQPCVLPTAVMAAMDRFKNYYLTSYTGRKLSWQTSTGSAEIRATFPPAKGSTKPRRHDLNVTTYQMCILVLFNTRDTYTLKEIRDETQIPDDELRRHLVSLCTPKHRILRKGSKGKGVSGDDDTFTYNSEFSSKMMKVKIPMVSMRDATGNAASEFAGTEQVHTSAGVASSSNSGFMDGSAEVPISVEEDRRHLLEAAIVRIMKARKILNHNDLVAEVTRQLSGRFVPPPQFVKKRVESLIEREYLERDDNDRRVYRYMA